MSVEISLFLNCAVRDECEMFNNAHNTDVANVGDSIAQ